MASNECTLVPLALRQAHFCHMCDDLDIIRICVEDDEDAHRRFAYSHLADKSLVGDPDRFHRSSAQSGSDEGTTFSSAKLSRKSLGTEMKLQRAFPCCFHIASLLGWSGATTHAFTCVCCAACATHFVTVQEKPVFSLFRCTYAPLALRHPLGACHSVLPTYLCTETDCKAYSWIWRST